MCHPDSTSGNANVRFVTSAAANASENARTIDDALRANGFYLGRAVLLLVASVLALLVVHAVLRATKRELPSGAESAA